MQNSANIIQQGNIVYLRSKNDWFAYDYTRPPIGSGAMGIVYRGWRQSDNRPVAIKQVIPKYAEIPSIRERAKLEASMLFSHRNLVEMLGYCEWAPTHGPIFIISAWVKGMTLKEHVEKHGLRTMKDATKRICESIYPVLDALDYLHSKGIIHLDVKPSNIMLENGYNIRLMDLGIAYTHDVIEMTSPGVLGTPMYAAPEQVLTAGSTHLTVDATTDLYELGITLYELLTGSNPFEAQTIEQTLIKQKTQILPPASQIPQKVMNVLLKATDKDKSKRYRTATEMRTALEEALKPHHNIIKKLINRIFD